MRGDAKELLANHCGLRTSLSARSPTRLGAGLERVIQDQAEVQIAGPRRSKVEREFDKPSFLTKKLSLSTHMLPTVQQYTSRILGHTLMDCIHELRPQLSVAALCVSAVAQTGASSKCRVTHT